MLLLNQPSRLAILLGIFFSTIPLHGGEEQQDTSNSTSQTETVQEKTGFQEIAERYQNSIVSISFLGRDQEELGLGTGFIINEKGMIATNRHVLGEARPIRVTFESGESFPVETIHANDKKADLAILTLADDALKATEFEPLPLGEAPRQGDQVAAIGHPRGYKNSLVTGIVSGTEEINGVELIQVSMPIDHGNSGGPLLNEQGEVVGVITYKSAATANVGFAMPVSPLKTILEKPNPILLSRWTTIGKLNPQLWQDHFGAIWRQRAGRINVSGQGDGFGGRALCLYQSRPEDVAHFALKVEVKLDDEAGAAGLVFHSDQNNRHYGFYPSGGRLRLSRFDGPDVYSWKILREIGSPSYRPGEWNELAVRIDEDRIRCYCNGEQVIDLRDRPGSEQASHVGLAKFRTTKASFRNFRLAEELPNVQANQEQIEKLEQLLDDASVEDLREQQFVSRLGKLPANSHQNLDRLAADLERRAEAYRHLARRAHQAAVAKRIITELGQEKPNLARLALLLARHDNPGVVVEDYLDLLDRYVNDIRKFVDDEQLSAREKRERLDLYLFEENGFHGSRTNYYHTSNSYLNEVMDDREGLPITLSVFYLSIADKLGLDVRGIGLPGHFVVRQYVDGEAGPMIDVFERGQVLGTADAMTRVEIQAGRPWDDQYLEPQTEREILIRMIANLRGIAEEGEDFPKLLGYLNLLAEIDTDNEFEHRYLRALVAVQVRDQSLFEREMEWLKTQENEIVGPQRLRELEAYANQQFGNPTAGDG